MSNKQEEAPPQQEQVTEQSILDLVMRQITLLIDNRSLFVPKGYSYENAIRSAYLLLQDVKGKTQNGQPGLPALKCTKRSIANSILKMVVLGLNPLKKQCDFIVRGNELTLDVEYTGNIALAKRHGGMRDIKAISVHEGDDFDFIIDQETGTKKVIKHAQSPDNLDNPIKYAYAKVFMTDGSSYDEIMTIKMIKTSWSQGFGYDKKEERESFHTKFQIEAVKKTVINLATKPLIRTSDDSALIPDDTTEVEPSVSDAVGDFVHDKTAKLDMGFTPIEAVKTEQMALPERQPNPMEQFEANKKEPEKVKATREKKVEEKAELVASIPEPVAQQAEEMPSFFAGLED